MSQTLKRTQVYLLKDQFRKVTKLAKEKHISFAQIMREAVDEVLRKNQAKWDMDPISKHIGILHGKEKDMAVNHDHYIYGD